MSSVRQSLSRFRSFCLNGVAWLFILGVYGVPLCLLLAWRYTVNLIARRLHSDFIVCSPNDTLLVLETPDKQPILTGGIILKVKGRIESSKLRILFEELFLSQENFDNYLNLYCDLVKFCGYLFKRQIVAKVKLENHLQERELENGENVKVALSSWFHQRFQKGLPLWQLLVLHDANNERSYMALKAHHVLVDGYSLVHILDKLTGVTSPGGWGPTSPENNNKNDPNKELEESSEKSWWERVRILYSMPQVVLSFTLPNISFSSTFPKSKPLSTFEMLPMAYATVALEPVKEIRRTLGVHFPAIIYGLQVGVLRAALLDGRGQSKEENVFMEENLPEHVLVTTSLPVIGYEHPRNKLTNHWSGGYIKIPLSTSSAKTRIEEGNKSLSRILENEGTFITWKYLAYFLWLFPAPFHYLLDKCEAVKLCKYRSSMSCIPQSCAVQYNLMGLEVENILHAPVMKDAFHTAVLLGCSSSHHNQIDLTLFGHPDWFPDQDQMDLVMSSYMHKELEKLAKECDLDFSRFLWNPS